MKKILFITPWYPTVHQPNNGIFIREHARAAHLAGNKIEVAGVIIQPDKKIFSAALTEYEDEYGIRVSIYELGSKLKFLRDLLYHSYFFQFLLLRKIVAKLQNKGFQPDIVHSNIIYPSGIMGARVAKHLKKPHIITEHWSKTDYFFKNSFFSHAGKNAYRKANAILPVSLFLKNRIQQAVADLTEDKFKIIGNVIDSEVFYYKEKKIDPNQLKFCAVATWNTKKTPDKYPELFIEALALFQKNCEKDIVLTIIGSGNRLNDLKKLCEERNLKATFTGYLDKTEIARYLQQTDFFVHASRIETFGVSTAEALICGVPVICSNVGALPELVNNSNGILCNNYIDDWVKGLKQLTETKYDRASIAEKMKEKFSAHTIGKAIDEVYEKVLH
ncbi:MAG: glycosyltransferase [Paludibacteraceae bacterium]|nr:glycosyltransferase [Paludibacteraceae bacterium]